MANMEKICRFFAGSSPQWEGNDAYLCRVLAGLDVNPEELKVCGSLDRNNYRLWSHGRKWSLQKHAAACPVATQMSMMGSMFDSGFVDEGTIEVAVQLRREQLGKRNKASLRLQGMSFLDWCKKYNRPPR